MVGLILMCFAFVVFCFSAAGYATFRGWVQTLPLGLALWVLGVILARVPF